MTEYLFLASIIEGWERERKAELEVKLSVELGWRHAKTALAISRILSNLTPVHALSSVFGLSIISVSDSDGKGKLKAHSLILKYH